VYDPDEYTASDARADEAWEAREDAIREQLALLVDPVVDEIDEMVYDRDEGEWIDNAHPWTRKREWLAVYDEDGEDGLRELLDEHFREDAEAAAEDAYDAGPCCNQFSCPCGNSNNRPD